MLASLLVSNLNMYALSVCYTVCIHKEQELSIPRSPACYFGRLSVTLHRLQAVNDYFCTKNVYVTQSYKFYLKWHLDDLGTTAPYSEPAE
jgi:hypothetical protein